MEYSKLPIEDLLVIWERLGSRNMFISDAVNPPFSRQMLEQCNTIAELKHKVTSQKWPIGKGFYYRDLCLINKVETNDEWFAIRDKFAFDNFNFHNFHGKEFERLMSRIFKASANKLVHKRY